jgi:ABC-type sulfate transport system substrate-binding protein
MKNAIVRCLKSGDWRRQAVCIVGVMVLIAITLGGRMLLANASDPVRLVVYGFSTQEEVFTQVIFPAFEQAWEAETGRDLTIEGVFGPSGTLAGQINLGAPADVAMFSNAQHVNWLKVGRVVRADAEPVTIGHTPMVIVTRPGNPYGIAGFGDLANPDLKLLHADPHSSGAGEWAVLAEYGSSLLESGDPVAAQAQLLAIWQNVRVLAPSARGALTLFELGAGDAFVTYEQDARLALERGVALEVVTPGRTIITEHVAVVVDDNVTPSERPVAQAFLDYLQGAGQRAFSRYHLRPASLLGVQETELVGCFTVEDLGGWSHAYLEIVDALWQKQVEPLLDLERDLRLPESGGS